MASQEMTEEEFRDAVSVASDATVWPTLEEAHFDLIVRRSRRADADGNAPSAAEWVSTFDFEAGVSFAFALRAGRAASLPDAKENEQAISASQIRRGLMAQSDEWKKLGRTGGRIGVMALQTPPLVRFVESDTIIVPAEVETP